MKEFIFVSGMLCHVGIIAQVISPLFPCTPNIENAYGVCAHISRPRSDFYVRKSDLNLMVGAGMDWVRTDFDYNTIRPINDKVRWNILDSTVIDTKKFNRNLLAVLDAKVNNIYAWDDTLAYREYVSSLVERYSGSVDYWEVINEADLIKDAGDIRDRYFNSLKSASRAIREVSDSSKVLLCSLASISDQWLDKIVEYKAYEDADIFNMHSYAPPETNVGIIEKLSEHMKSNGWQLPVWMTELGMHTAMDTMTNDAFFLEVIPQALNKVGINPKDTKVAVIYDERYQVLSEDEMDLCSKEFLRVDPIRLSYLDSLDVATFPVLFASSQEFFPMQYFNSLVNYVRNGGTIILSYGLPFYYDLKGDGSKVQINTRDYKKLHLSVMPWWSEEANRNHAPQIPSQMSCAEFFSTPNYIRLSKSCSARYLLDKNLKGNDKMIPIIMAGDDNYMGCLTAIYKMDSDLKGNVIMSTRTDLRSYIDKEREQARRVARQYILSFAMGIDKVFWYNLRALEKNKYNKEDNFGLLHANLSPKIAYFAYQSLTKMLPDGSLRPIVEKYGDMFVGYWTKKDGQNMCAIWTNGNDKEIDVTGKNVGAIYDYLGKEINLENNKIAVGQGVSYIAMSIDDLRDIISNK